MKRLTIVVQPDDAALLVGGLSSPRHGGHRATARDADERPVIPASALRGALRLELERLLEAKEVAACSANREADPDRACDCPVCRLFGREAGTTGSLRLEDARLATDDDSSLLRPRVGVSRKRRRAVDQHLLFAETTRVLDGKKAGEVFRARASLVPQGPDGAAGLEEDLSKLKAACRALRFLGSGRAQGLGWVTCRLEEEPEQPSHNEPGRERSGVQAEVSRSSEREVSLRFRFEAQAPLHLGLGRPVGAYQPSRDFAPGSTVRGALAYALLEQQLARPEDPRFQRLFPKDEDSRSGARFGSARAEGHVPCLTRRKCRPGDHVFDDLVTEVIRRRAAEHSVALALSAPCPEPECKAVKALPWAYRGKQAAPERRVHTRTALNRRTLTAMDQKLFSIEVLDPPVHLVARVSGLDAETAELLSRLDGTDLWLGGKRSQGLGRCRVSVEVDEEPEADAARQACEVLRGALAAGWKTLREAAPELREELLSANEMPVAVVLSEPWRPKDEPLGETLARGPLSGFKPLASFVALTEEGRFGAREARRWGASDQVLQGEQPPESVAAPGSVYVYAVDRATFDSELTGWVRNGRRGAGVQAELGWGRFVVRGPEDDF